MKDIRAMTSSSTIAQVPLHYNRTLFDEPSLRALIGTFDEASRSVMDAAASKARRKIGTTSIFMFTPDVQFSAGPFRWGNGTSC